MALISRLTLLCIISLLFSTSLWAKELKVPFHQQHTQVWCWAATIAMVGEYMTGQKAEDCEVLSAYDRALGGSGICCQNPQPCNRTGQVQEMKNIMGNLYKLSGYHHLRPLSFDELKKEIDNERPMIAALQTNFSGHVIVIIGYSSPNKVIVLDPISGRHEVSYQQIIANFQTGYWSQTLTVNKTSAISSKDSCKYANDGTCDEPKLCKSGTDTTDCSKIKKIASKDVSDDTDGDVVPAPKRTKKSAEEIEECQNDCEKEKERCDKKEDREKRACARSVRTNESISCRCPNWPVGNFYCYDVCKSYADDVRDCVDNVDLDCDGKLDRCNSKCSR